MKRIALLGLVALATSCTEGLNTVASYVSGGNKGALVHAPPPSVAAVIKSESNGVVVAALDPAEKRVQVVAAAAGSKIAGASIIFPPGSLSVATDLVVEESAPIAAGVAQELGLSAEEAKPAGAALLIESTAKVDAASPFTVSLAIPEGAGLLQLIQSTKRYGIAYRVFRFLTGESLAGLIPPNLVRIEGGKVSFDIQYFGAYQLVELTREITEVAEIKSTVPLVAKADADASPLTIDRVTPLVAPGGAVVTVEGKNLRRTITLALGGRALKGLDVKSDAVATFVMPAEVPFGPTLLFAEQDGVRAELPLFAQADKTGFPLITMEPAGVCAGVVYFDAFGTKQTGTRTCGGATVDTSSFMQKSAYDADGDGKVDASATAGTAATALSAGSATSANFAKGQAGAGRIEGDVMHLDGNGNYYRVTGNGTVRSIVMAGGAAAGTRIVLETPGAVFLEPSQTLRPLVFGGYAGTSPREKLPAWPGDIRELLSLGGDRWVTMAHDSPPRIVLSKSANVTTGASGDGRVALPFDVKLKDHAGEFNANAGGITFNAAVCVSMAVTVEVQNNAFPAGDCGSNPGAFYIRVGFHHNGTPYDMYAYPHQHSGEACPDGRRYFTMNTGGLTFLPGETLTFDVRSTDYGNSPLAMTIQGSARTQVSIERGTHCPTRNVNPP